MAIRLVPMPGYPTPSHLDRRPTDDRKLERAPSQDVGVHQPHLGGLVDDVLGPGALPCRTPRRPCGSLSRQVVRRLAQILLLVGQGEVNHGDRGLRSLGAPPGGRAPPLLSAAVKSHRGLRAAADAVEVADGARPPGRRQGSCPLVHSGGSRRCDSARYLADDGRSRLEREPLTGVDGRAADCSRGTSFNPRDLCPGSWSSLTTRPLVRSTRNMVLPFKPSWRPTRAASRVPDLRPKQPNLLRSELLTRISPRPSCWTTGFQTLPPRLDRLSFGDPRSNQGDPEARRGRGRRQDPGRED